MAINGETYKMEKFDLTLSTFVQYDEDFRFWVNSAGRAHRLPEKEIAKMFVTGLNLTYSVKKSIQEVLRHNKKLRTSQELNFLLIETFWRSQIVLKWLM